MLLVAGNFNVRSLADGLFILTQSKGRDLNQQPLSMDYLRSQMNRLTFYHHPHLAFT